MCFGPMKREAGGSPAQVRYCKSQILNAVSGHEITCGNRGFRKRESFVVMQLSFIFDILKKGFGTKTFFSDRNTLCLTKQV